MKPEVVEEIHKLYHAFAREGWYKSNFSEEWENIRNSPNTRYTIFMSEQIDRFRAHYAMLLGGMALLLDVPPSELNPGMMYEILAGKLSKK